MEPVKKILVLDDSLLLLSWTRDALVAAGYHVDITDNVWAAKQLAQMQPDLILMDVHFTDAFREGAAATKVLKRDAATHHIPVVLYSGLEQDLLVALSEDCGADGFICKTNDTDLLVQQVTYYLSAVDDAPAAQSGEAVV